MKPFTALCVAAFAAFFATLISPAFADTMVAREGKKSISITGNPCPDSVKNEMAPELRDRLREAYGTINGKHSRGCWFLVVGDDAMYVVLDGLLWRVPSQMFKNEPGV